MRAITKRRGDWSGRARWYVYGLLWVFSLPSYGASVEVTARFRPDAANPMLNRFENTTPNRGTCAENPAYCNSLGLQSLLAPLSFRTQVPIRAGHSEREGPMVKVPANWRSLNVAHEQTGESRELKVRIAAFGASYRTPIGIVEIVGGGTSWEDINKKLWGGRLARYARAPCLSTSVWHATYGNGGYFFWQTPVGAEAACPLQSAFDIPAGFMFGDGGLNRFNFGYQIETPDPLSMSSGIYTGKIAYTVGPNMDFDMGDLLLPTDSLLEINFTLTVEHTLKVEIPPGGNRIQLEPQGGWQAWLNQGRKPARLFRDQTFNLSASSRFKMQLECGTGQIGDTCAVKNAAGDQVPLDVLVSLPAGMTNTDGAAVNRLPLRVSGTGSELFQPSFYVDRRPGILHFEVQREGVEEMLKREGETWSGSVSVIWDSEV
ncbi:hypothetical protein [Pseudomonas lactucae]|uniref:hypothetical protein n=1 Tax=Pseudomonas lactucae TaxID=2813360 RepID=UPI002FCCFE93